MPYLEKCAIQYPDKCVTLLSRRFLMRSVLPPTHKLLYTPPSMWLQLHMLLLDMPLWVMDMEDMLLLDMLDMEDMLLLGMLDIDDMGV